MELKSSKHTQDASALQKTADFVQAFMLGFEVQVGGELLRRRRAAASGRRGLVCVYSVLNRRIFIAWACCLLAEDPRNNRAATRTTK